MQKSTVFFKPVHNESIEEVSLLAKDLLRKVIDHDSIPLEKNIPLKVHTGQPGNITFVRPTYFDGLIDYLKEQGSSPYFIETNMVTGPRSKESTHRIVAQKHGFSRIPLVIADGENGDEDTLIPISKGKHLSKAHIAKQLASQKQIIVLSHFKGHIATGFGGALKMLGIGFASRNGKMEVHTKNYTASQKTIDWNDMKKLYWGDEFSERVAEYAQAAVHNKKYIYINFMINVTENCDCDGEIMKPIYENVGVFASSDPVAIDKACYDMLEKREGKAPFSGTSIFKYAEGLGLGSTLYKLELGP